MNLNDRVALLLGRAIIRAEEMTIRAEQAEEKLAQQTGEIAEIRAEQDRLAALMENDADASD